MSIMDTQRRALKEYSKYSLHWVLRPASVTGFEVVKANGGRYIKWISAWYSDQTVAKSNFGPVQS